MKIVIDTEVMRHALRRWWWGLFGKTRKGHCVDCGKRLTSPERDYYGNMCERCIGLENERYPG